MNKNLEHLFILYATGLPVHQELLGWSKETLAATLIDLLTLYINDRNSSTVREWITIKMAGYERSESKLGYNGYRMAVPDGPKEFCEAKPANVYHRDDGSISRKLSGNGNFTDYTPERLEKDLETNPCMLVSGFVDGQLVYILKFPFRCLESRLRSVLARHFPENRRPEGQYLRGASFNFHHYRECKGLEIVFISQSLDRFQDALTPSFYRWLKEKGS